MLVEGKQQAYLLLEIREAQAERACIEANVERAHGAALRLAQGLEAGDRPQVTDDDAASCASSTHGSTASATGSRESSAALLAIAGILK